MKKNTVVEFAGRAQFSDALTELLRTGPQQLNLQTVEEVIRKRGPWKTIEEVENATIEWVDWFNNRRLLEPIGNIPPAEFEKQYYQQTNESAMAA